MDIKRCLAQGKKIEAQDDVGATPLHKAVLNDNAEAVLSLLNAGADMEATWAEANYGTSLHLAAIGGLSGIIRLLVSHGGNLQAEDEWGQSPLHSVTMAARASGDFSGAIAARSRAVESIEALVEAGASLSAKGRLGHTPLHDLVENNFSMEDDEHDNTDETRIVAEAIDTLVAAGAELEATDRRGRTPLHLAARNNLFESAVTIKALVDAGANVGARDSLGKSSLHLAAEFDAQKWRTIRRCTLRGDDLTSSQCEAKVRPGAVIHVRNATAAIHGAIGRWCAAVCAFP